MNRLFRLTWLCIIGVVFVTGATADDLKFSLKEKGFYEFNTGVLKGIMRADGQTQGIVSLIDIASGQEIAYGGSNPGLYSFYRVFSKEKRYGDAVRDWPLEPALLSDGALQLQWPAREEIPFEIMATYRWRSANILDVETAVTSSVDLPGFEVFLSSYFAKSFQCWIYARPTIHNGGEPKLIAADVNPLLEGTYLAFPRDRQAAQMIFDGRWELGHNPVDFSIPRFYALPIGMRKDPTSGLSIVQMSLPEACFAIETPYNREPPDGVAGHGSIYFSFFGEDIKAGQTLRARNRMIVGRHITEEDILKEYKSFSSSPQ